MKRTSIGRVLTLPTRWTWRVWMTRRSVACSLGGMSPISSRNTVPPGAVSSRPALASFAPVNAPFSWPNSSLSSRPSETAAQLMATNGAFARGDRRWISCAITSLPTPVSPRMITLMVPFAALVASP